jgi:hypothetical protein
MLHVLNVLIRVEVTLHHLNTNSGKHQVSISFKPLASTKANASGHQKGVDAICPHVSQQLPYKLIDTHVYVFITRVVTASAAQARTSHMLHAAHSLRPPERANCSGTSSIKLQVPH